MITQKYKPIISSSSKDTQHLIIGISGASGIIYGLHLLEILKSLKVETHLVMSKAAELTCNYELQLSVPELKALATHTYDIEDISALISSGSFKTMGMIVAPCSANSMAEIAIGLGHNLLCRAASVTLKERRRLVLLVREAPLHEGHLKRMLDITNMGGVIYPPTPAFYNMPKTIDNLIHYIIGRVLDLFEIEVMSMNRWNKDHKGENK